MELLTGWAVKLLIPVLTPMAIALAKTVIVKMQLSVPKHWLPTAAPAVGAILEALVEILAGGIPGASTAVNGALNGTVGVFVRELYDQWKGRFDYGPAKIR